MYKLLILISFLFTRFVRSHEEDTHTIRYDSDNFSTEIVKKNHFVMFYAPWCGHCQRLHPTWEQLAEMLNEEDGNIRIAKVDCTVDSKVCAEHDVTGYPTLKFFKQGSLEGVKFRGTRDLPSLTTFINEQLRSGVDFQIDEAKAAEAEVLQSASGLVELTEETFEKHVNQGKHFVEFYAPWCGHCQNLAPTWEKLAGTVTFEGDVSISKVDCTQYRNICNKYEIKGYPTLLWIEDGKRIVKYQGQRSHDELKEFVDKMLGAAQKKEEEKSETGEVQSPVLILSGDDFEDKISKGVVLVKFFAPWCGHCKRLAPTWDELAKKFVENEDVKVAKVDCTSKINKDVCSREDVDGFPTILLYKDGKKIDEYDGDRSLNDLYEFINKNLAVSHDEL